MQPIAIVIGHILRSDLSGPHTCVLLTLPMCCRAPHEEPVLPHELWAPPAGKRGSGAAGGSGRTRRGCGGGTGARLRLRSESALQAGAPTEVRQKSGFSQKTQIPVFSTLLTLYHIETSIKKSRHANAHTFHIWIGERRLQRTAFCVICV